MHTMLMQSKCCSYFILLTISTLILFGCKKDKKSFGQLQLFLKDSPAQFDSLLIRLYSIELISDSLKYKEKIVLKSSKAINILQYTNERDTLIANLFYDAPEINRLVITFWSSPVLYQKGKSMPLAFSDTIRNYRLSNPIPVKNSGINKLYIDFDAYFSIKKNKKNSWSLEPVVHLRLADSTGSVRGWIKTSGKMPFVWLISPYDTLSTLPNTNGYFHILYVPPGKYSLWVPITNEDEEEPTMILEKVFVEPSKVTGVGTLLIN